MTSTSGVYTDRDVSDRMGNASRGMHEGAHSSDNAGDVLSKAANSAKSNASDFASSAADTFKSAVEDQKSAGAEAIGDVARAAKGAADNFQEQSPELANAIRRVAERVEGVSNNIRDQSLNEIMASVTEFAGQRPVAFFGCGILAGVVLSRLLSTSSR